MPRPADLLLGRLAVERGRVAPDQVQRALQDQARREEAGESWTPLGRLLVAAGAIDEAALTELVALAEKAESGPPVPSGAVGSPDRTVRCDAATIRGQPPAAQAPPDGGPPLLGRRFGKYELVSVLGRGGMGLVYKAYHPDLKSHIALKVLLGGDDASKEDEERFRREAQASARLRHPGIVTVHDLGVADGKSYIAMEFVDGSGLDKVLAEPAKFGIAPARGVGPGERGGIDASTALGMTREIAEALHAAHEAGVIHRDLKPANVLRERSGRLKVADFGLARFTDAGGAAATSTGTTLGTPAYMSPEQAEGRIRDVDARSDVYQIGAILYELLTGRPPYAGASPMAIAIQVLADDPAPPRSVNPAIDPDAETICLKAMARDKAARYADARALAEDCARVLDGEAIRARRESLPRRARRWARRHPRATGAVLALTVVGCAFAAYDLLRSPQPGTAFPVRPTNDAAGPELDLAALEPWLLEMEATFTDARLTLEVKRDRSAGPWNRCEALLGPARATPATRAEAWALSGWARRLAGYEEEGLLWMRKAGEADPSSPHGLLAEAFVHLSTLVEREELPLCVKEFGPMKFAPLPAAGPQAKSARRRLEEIRRDLDTLGAAPGAGLAGAAEAIGAVLESQPGAAETALTRTLASPRLRPFQTELRFARARMRYLQKEFDEEIEEIGEIVKARPGQPEARYFLAAGRLALGTQADRSKTDVRPLLDQAITGLGETLDLDKNLVGAFRCRAEVFVQLGLDRENRGGDPRGWFEKAIADYGEVLKRVPDDPEAWAGRANGRYRLGMNERDRGADPCAAFEQAIADLGELLQRAPRHEDALFLRGHAHRGIGEWASSHGGDPRTSYRLAIEDYEGASRLESSPGDVLESRAITLGKYAEAEEQLGGDPRQWIGKAIAAYGEVLARSPWDVGDDKAQVFNNRGYNLLRLGMLDVARGSDAAGSFRDAMADFDAAIRERPGFAWPFFNKGVIFEACGDLEQARLQFEKARGLDPKYSPSAAAVERVNEALAVPWIASAGAAAKAIGRADYAAARTLYVQALAGAELGAEMDPRRKGILRAAHYDLSCIDSLASAGQDAPNAAPKPVDPAEAARLRDQAFAHLTAALDLGYADAAHLGSDPDLVPLHDDARWAQLLAKLKLPPK